MSFTVERAQYISTRQIFQVVGALQLNGSEEDVGHLTCRSGFEGRRAVHKEVQAPRVLTVEDVPDLTS